MINLFLLNAHILIDNRNDESSFVEGSRDYSLSVFSLTIRSKFSRVFFLLLFILLNSAFSSLFSFTVILLFYITILLVILISLFGVFGVLGFIIPLTILLINAWGV